MKDKKNIFESQWTLIGEIIALASLFVAYRKSESEFVYVCYIILILAIPFFIAGVISVTRYNKILKCGQRYLPHDKSLLRCSAELLPSESVHSADCLIDLSSSLLPPSVPILCAKHTFFHSF